MWLRRLAVLVCLLVAAWGTTAHAEALQLPAIQVVPIKDSGTGRSYELYIKLPEGYDSETDKTHPVIYIADALWHIEIISGSIEYLVKDAILVGVSWEKGVPPQQSRMRDYMPNEYTGENYDHATGKASDHVAFLKNDVFKFVESEYKADSARRTYFGYSASGTFGAYILLTQPGTFQNYIIGSPATLFGDHLTYEYEPFAKIIPDSINANVFVSVGSDEKADAIEHAIGLAQFLKARKTENSQVEFRVIESADHGFAFPATAMRSLYWLADISSQ